jgi:DinB superfamily
VSDDRAGRLADALGAARRAFWDAFDSLPPERRGAERIVGEWGARELVAHLGYWAGNSTEAIHRVARGEAEAFDGGAGSDDVDARNATVARIARQTPLAEVRRREAAAAEALLSRLRSLDPAQLDVVLPDGGTLEERVRVDGPEHYDEHARELGA